MRLTLPSPKPCSECGSGPIWHTPEYAANLVGAVLRPVLVAATLFATATLPAQRPKPYGRFSMGATAVHLGLAEYLTAPDQHTLLLDQVLWDEAKARGIRMREWRPLGLPVHAFEADLPQGRLHFDSTPLQGSGVWWVDDKAVLKKQLVKHGMPVSRGGAVWSMRGALALFARLGAPVVVKPAEGSATRHTTMRITTKDELVRAYRVARQLGPLVMVEQELAGAVYRPTLVNGRLAATLRRDPPQIVGDGTHTVQELVAQENLHPKRQGPYYSPIPLGVAAEAELARQGLTVGSIPAAGQAVILHQKINWSVGGTTTDVSDTVHPDNKKLFEEVAALLKAPLLGIDFITTDISRSWREVPCGIIECNARPFFDNHHLPFNGTPRNVAGRIWDEALSSYAGA